MTLRFGNSKRRPGVRIIVIALAALVLAGAARYPPATDMRSHLVKGECADCHADIAREWGKAGHAQSWTSPLYQAYRKEFAAPKECDPCHAPQPLHMTGIGDMPKVRVEDRDRGVDCLTCHLAPDGSMRGPTDGVSPFHKTQREPTLYTMELRLCASCHGQPSVAAHDTVTPYQSSRSFKGGETCQTCHMPEVQRKPSRKSESPKRGGEHTWYGSRDQGLLRSTLLLDAEETKEGLSVYVTNAAAHSLPAAPLREMRLGILVTDAAGKILHSRTTTYRHPLGLDGKPLDPDAGDPRIAAEESRIIPLPVSSAKLRGSLLRVNILYRRHAKGSWISMASLTRRF